MKRNALFVLLVVPLLGSPRFKAQTPSPADSYSTEALLARARQANGGKPLSTEVLARYPNHYTMLVSRHADGQSELHERFADVIIILEGQGQLVVGGTMQGAKPTEPGEQRGTGIEGGTTSPLKRGDIVHIPANVPHQVKIAANGNITYFVVKVDEGAK